jgi:hypothetical protein
MTFERCLFNDANSGTAIWLGDYTASPAIPDADIANFNIVRCQFFDNKNSVRWDSIQALEVNINSCFMSRAGAGLFTQEQIYMVRGGSASITGSYIGGLEATGTKFAIYVKDGWVNVKDTEFEYGVGGSAGTLWLDTPALSTSVTGTPTSLMNCRISGEGVTGTGNYVLISSSNHPLSIVGCSFQGKTAGSLVTFAINNAGGSRVVSVNNKYTGYFWSGTGNYNISSVGDTYRDATTSKFMPVNLGRTRFISSTDSPYTVAFDDETIVSTNGACTINLPTLGEPPTGGKIHRTIVIKRTSASGSTTIVPAGGNTIDGLASVVLNNNQYSAIVIESDGFSQWMIKGFYSPGNFVTASTGVGTVKMGGVNNADSAGWMQIVPGKYIPYWTVANP